MPAFTGGPAPLTPGETMDADGVIHAAPEPQPTPRTRLDRLQAMRQPAPALSAPVASPTPPPAGPPTTPAPTAVGPEVADFAAMVEEARAAFKAALKKAGVRDTDARWYVGALAVGTAVLDAHGRLIQREAAEQRAAFERLMREAEDRLRSPLGPEERVLLRTEIVRAAAGAIPGPEERAAFAQAVVEAVRTMMPPPAPLPSPGPPPAPTIQPDVLRQAAGAGAKLAVAQALTPKALQSLTLRYAAWLAAAFAGGAVFGAAIILALR